MATLLLLLVQLRTKQVKVCTVQIKEQFSPGKDLLQFVLGDELAEIGHE